MNKTILELLSTVKATELLFAFCLISIVVTLLIANKKKIREKLNSWRKKENRKESEQTLVYQNNERLNKLEEQREIDVQQSIRHNDAIEELLDDLKVSLHQHIESDKRKTIATLRSTLWRMHRDFMSQDYITKDGLMTFKEVGKVYEEAGGDDIYHDKLEPEVMALEVREVL